MNLERKLKKMLSETNQTIEEYSVLLKFSNNMIVSAGIASLKVLYGALFFSIV